MHPRRGVYNNAQGHSVTVYLFSIYSHFSVSWLGYDNKLPFSLLERYLLQRERGESLRQSVTGLVADRY